MIASAVIAPPTIQTVAMLTGGVGHRTTPSAAHCAADTENARALNAQFARKSNGGIGKNRAENQGGHQIKRTGQF